MKMIIDTTSICKDSLSSAFHRIENEDKSNAKGKSRISGSKIFLFQGFVMCHLCNSELSNRSHAPPESKGQERQM